jgi:hypothetical protein
MRFDVSDPRFARVQALFATLRPEEGRALLRKLLREWLTLNNYERRSS